MSLKNKVVWVTGASSGIGEALVYALHGYGCRLIISSRSAEALERVKHNCDKPEQVQIIPLDLADHHAMQSKVDAAISFFGKIDVLINNAGISQRSLIRETDFAVYKKLMDINYLGTIALSKALLNHFIDHSSGHFVTVTSLMGKFGSPYRSGYCGAKHALHGFFDVMRMEHEKDGVAVTLVCPGFVRTNVAKNALTGDGSKQITDDEATQNGLAPNLVAKKIIKAVEQRKFETYIGGKEVQGIYMKRFFPKLLHRLVLRSQVR
ncbi:MAG: SDR family oxidoreductase [Allomuricauda sp.]|nr:MAG: SDR family oxidoreductase [Allomuricauda sp.]